MGYFIQVLQAFRGLRAHLGPLIFMRSSVKQLHNFATTRLPVNFVMALVAHNFVTIRLAGSIVTTRVADNLISSR